MQVVYNFGREEPGTGRRSSGWPRRVARHLEPGQAARRRGGAGVRGVPPAGRHLGAGRAVGAAGHRPGDAGPAEGPPPGPGEPSGCCSRWSRTGRWPRPPSSPPPAGPARTPTSTGLPATTDDACYRAMDWLLEIRERPGEGRSSTGSRAAWPSRSTCCSSTPPRTYFVTEEADAPVARDEHGNPVPGGAEGSGRAEDGRVPDLGQVQGPPRRPAPGRHRDGRHPRRDPAARLVLAREHRRLRADPPGQGRHARLDPVAGSSGSPTGASPPRRTAATCARAATTTSSARSSAPAPPRPPPPCPGRAATRKSPGTCGSRKSGSPRTSGSSSATTPKAPSATPRSAPA